MTLSLAYLDLALCVDITGSMTPFIAAARAHAVRIIEALQATPDVDLRVAIVGYRDHGSLQLIEQHGFSSDGAEVKRRLDALEVRSPPENTDAAEAVFSGLVACGELPWREGAYRIVILVGDAPPHGCGATASPYPDRYAVDPTGRSLDDMANELEAAGIFVHALAMVPSNTRHHDGTLELAFRRIGIGTGGGYHATATGGSAISVIESITGRCTVHLDFDRRLHELLPRESDVDALAKQLAATPADVHAGMMRLRQRRLL
jgi:hypothetical protein